MPLESAPEAICPSCGVPYRDHLGLVGKCALLKSAQERIRHLDHTATLAKERADLLAARLAAALAAAQIEKELAQTAMARVAELEKERVLIVTERNFYFEQGIDDQKKLASVLNTLRDTRKRLKKPTCIIDDTHPLANPSTGSLNVIGTKSYADLIDRIDSLLSTTPIEEDKP